MTDCYECGGTGECPSCHGVGHGLTSKCVICNGSGACQACNAGANVAATVNSPGADLRRNFRILLFILLPLLYFFGKLYFSHD
jgi:hypothetical protein